MAALFLDGSWSGGGRAIAGILGSGVRRFDGLSIETFVEGGVNVSFKRNCPADSFVETSNLNKKDVII